MSGPQRERVRGLYAITAADAVSDQALLANCEAVLRGGASVLQYRDKQAGPEQRMRRARQLQSLCRSFRALFIVNDDVALALELAADGIHIGREDGQVKTVRRQLPAAMLLGVSCYNDLQRARLAADEGADYLAFGAMYPSPSKPLAVQAPPHTLGEARSLGVPVVAIGGITTDNAAPLLAAGVDAIAVISGLFDAGSVAEMEARARRFCQLFANPEENR